MARIPDEVIERLKQTDIAAVFLGFGVFLVNSASTFSQFDGGGTVGWSTRRQGYLSESQLLNALSIFAALLGIEPRRIMPHLKASFRRPYRINDRAITGSESKLGILRSVPPVNADTRDIVPRSSQHRR
jgi:hypothetical protein